ncbi:MULTISPECIES: ATP-binding cassette domain-containing protein [Streptomyces]|uniref:ABC-type xenobiotic transporter n=2 Tax=Streptomyces diastaticus group TaxID=2849069 RepID=A0A8H9HPQ9_9ACTN|nr:MULTISPECIES: ATP-binding cassette domain-containing protein [Streptomyces]NEE47712.1 ATP-binding cassette domain-containing protein [Streptomyces sp. SID8455]QNE82383.1 ATP-binding cassette domain-containing protein [Streptomyces rutgersensis]WPR52340.1 ATP-binding cassette domain-containing protein [Streptomyces sp. S399]GFH64346.1 daunorubicin resistance protein DrrA family ABC transporter ATP-binding protein [Streptomyces rutgersensis]GFH78056.1 daunorubicin resistance protein DrrA fami
MRPPPAGAVEVRGLSKSYGRRAVLHSVDLRVPAGGVLALLGPNGAGKTTTVRVLATLTGPDAGSVRVAGYDVVTERRRVQRAISLTGQFAAVDETQTGAENLWTTARLAGLTRAAARARAAGLLERFGLSEAGGRLVRTYSGGMRRRLDLAAGLVGEPRVLFLDEPTTGLDPRSRQQLWQVVRELAAAGTAVLLTTQYLEEADRLADRVAVLHEGRVAAEGTPAELKAAAGRSLLEVTAAGPAAHARLAAHTRHPVPHRPPGTLALAFPTSGDAHHVRTLLDELDPGRDQITDFAVRRATLDDVFLALTGTTPADAKEPGHV